MTLDKHTRMYLTVLELTPVAAKREALLESLLSVRERTRIASGCLTCAVYSACSCEDRILYMEEWRSRRDLESHIRSDLYRKILGAAELSVKPQEMRFFEVLESAGMDLIESLRCGSAVD